MKIQRNRIALAAGLVLAGTFAAVQAAPFVGQSSNTANVAVGPSTVNGGPHQAGLAGIGVNSTGLNNPVDFNGLSVYGGAGAVKVLNFPYSGAPTTHDNLGVFAFAKVGSQDVWFGEWHARTDTAEGLATHTVYFIGDGADTSVPTSGTATYSVVGLNNYSAGNQLTGTFTANFGTARLTGSIQNASGFAVNIGTATINSNASISGSNAIARQSGTAVASSGAVSGQFYANQAALAGIVDFAGVQHDTAFGGTRN